MKRFELSIGVYIDAEHIDMMWEKFRESGVHDLLNELDAEDGYASEVVGEVKLNSDGDPVPPEEPELPQVAGCATIEVRDVQRISEKAWLVDVLMPNGKYEEHWLPKSQIKDTDCVAEGDSGYFVVKEWLAKANGFIESDDE